MVHSMTGFGEARREEDDRTYQLEIRSVNNRYLKTSIHLPDEFAQLETELERLLRQGLVRGSVTLRLHVREQNPQAALRIDTSVLQAYIAKLREAAGDDRAVTIDLATLLTLPGVERPLDISDRQREARWQILSQLTQTALERLIAMRTAEGDALAADLKTHCEQIRKSLELIRVRTPVVIQEYRDRLQARVEELIAGSNVRLAEDDLLKEVSIYAERSDISEELSRLEGHLEQFAVLMGGREASGRKLEFVAQEMLREANTMGSKAGDAAIARQVVEVKSAVDRIKEQVQNAV